MSNTSRKLSSDEVSALMEGLQSGEMSAVGAAARAMNPLGEINALKGMKQSLIKFKPTLIIEISDGILENSSVNSKAIYDFLFDLNYEPYNIDKKGNIQDFSSKDINYHNYIFLPKSN